MDELKCVLNIVGPLYSVLHYVDGDEGIVFSLMPRMLSVIKEMESYFGLGTQTCNRYMRMIKERV